jgi:hypothetical protein
MVVMIVVMKVRSWENATIPSVMMVMVMVMVMVEMVMVEMVMVVILRDLFSAFRLCLSDARVIHLQRIQRIGNWLQKVAITARCSILCGFGNDGLCGAHCRQCSRSAHSPAIFLSICFPPVAAAKTLGLQLIIFK